MDMLHGCNLPQPDSFDSGPVDLFTFRICMTSVFVFGAGLLGTSGKHIRYLRPTSKISGPVWRVDSAASAHPFALRPFWAKEP